jgi:hypothetical protein
MKATSSSFASASSRASRCSRVRSPNGLALEWAKSN